MKILIHLLLYFIIAVPISILMDRLVVPDSFEQNHYIWLFVIKYFILYLPVYLLTEKWAIKINTKRLTKKYNKELNIQ